LQKPSFALLVPLFTRYRRSNIPQHPGFAPVKLISRFLRAAIVALALLPFSAPAFAGDREVAYLQSLAGTWQGKGKVSGPEGGNVACRLTFRASGLRLSFSGRCALSGGSGAQSFSGVIRYNESTGAYESSSQGQTVRGRKSGSSLVFVTAVNNSRAKGTSTMTLSPSAISVQFKMLNPRSGATSTGSIPFRKG
jgi:hypothetical protein